MDIGQNMSHCVVGECSSYDLDVNVIVYVAAFKLETSDMVVGLLKWCGGGGGGGTPPWRQCGFCQQ